MIREIVHIDTEKCDGCGLCVPACQEGAIQIVDGKARLAADNLCDGVGACLGHCPQGAITIEKREAEVFDEQAVEAHQDRIDSIPEADLAGQFAVLNPKVALNAALNSPHPNLHGGCPSSRFSQFLKPAGREDKIAAGESRPQKTAPSELTHFPIQLRLLPPTAPALQNASLLLVADCVPVAYPDFQRRMLRGRSVAVACPKLDDTSTYLPKLIEMLKLNDIKDITVAHVEVPCCTGLLNLAIEARRQSGKKIPLRDMVVSVRGELISDREIPG